MQHTIGISLPRLNSGISFPGKDGWRRRVVVSGGGGIPSRCVIRSTQPCIPQGSLNRVSASAGARAGMSPLPGGSNTAVISYGT